MSNFLNVTDESLNLLTGSFKHANNKRKTEEKVSKIQKAMFQVTDVHHETMLDNLDDVSVADFWNTASKSQR